MFGRSGFAVGNYNYRINTLALNFVGSGLKDCSTSDLPVTCYSGAFVPYSLYHQGPYVVRDASGNDFQVDLFHGNIEHARGLAAERYITNPMSTADTELLSTYQRLELQGRPLDGTFVVRVWDEDGLQFNALQDIQLVLDYRYWTRNN